MTAMMWFMLIILVLLAAGCAYLADAVKLALAEILALKEEVSNCKDDIRRLEILTGNKQEGKML
jgi:hypothetical protein